MSVRKVNDTHFSRPAHAGIEILLSTEGNRAFPAHLHEKLCVGLVIQGKRILEIGGQMFQVRKGEVFVVNPGLVHGMRSCGGSKAIVIAVNADIANRFFAARNGFARPVVRNAHLRAVIEKMSKASVELRGLRNRLLTLLAAYSTPAQEKKALPGPVAVARNIIDKDGKVALKSLARSGKRSRWHLVRMFGKMVGMTPHAYQMMRAVQQAKKLLVAGKSPAEAALDAGFYDQSHLHRHFKKFVGITPAAYAAGSRRKHQRCNGST